MYTATRRACGDTEPTLSNIASVAPRAKLRPGRCVAVVDARSAALRTAPAPGSRPAAPEIRLHASLAAPTGQDIIRDTDLVTLSCTACLLPNHLTSCRPGRSKTVVKIYIE